MSRTRRKTYQGDTVRDGEWCRRCGSTNCDICGTGYYKKASKKKRRRFLFKKDPETY